MIIPLPTASDERKNVIIFIKNYCIKECLFNYIWTQKIVNIRWQRLHAMIKFSIL